MPTKDDIIARLRRELDRAHEARQWLAAEPAAQAQRDALRAWQAARLARTYADLLASPRYAATAEFFLSDLYGPKDLTRHEQAVRKLVPVMEKILPATGLETVADAVELQALSEALDAAMITALGADALKLDDERYARAFRNVGRRADRERQITLICELGRLLDTLTRQPFIGTTLTLMRKPARLAGLADLQDFLERGYSAFKGMRGADEFLGLIGSRERALLEQLLAGEADRSPRNGTRR